MVNPRLFDSNRLKRSLKKKGATGNRAAKTICGQGFPLYYVLRNFGWLRLEQWWTALSPRARRNLALRIVSERIAIFNEVKNCRKKLKEAAQIPLPNHFEVSANHFEISTNHFEISAPAYCNKCGLCCEVASGMPDFPSPGALPGRWREFFANGLGRGHRFCPFLWEDNSSGGSLCAIYPLRSNPCRLFGSEECDFFWKSKEPHYLSSARKILLVGRWLVKLVNACKLPPAAAGVTGKRPKFLKFDRV